MKLTAHQIEELERLITLLMEGTLGPPEFERLERMIAGSAEARWYYVTRVDMVGSIGWALHDQADLKNIASIKTSDSATEFLDLLDEIPTTTTPNTADANRAPRPHRRRPGFGAHFFDKAIGTMQAMTRHALAVGLTAAVLMIGVGVVLGLMQQRGDVAQQDPTEPNHHVGIGQYRAATLIATDDCQWLSEQAHPVVGDRLQTGQQIALERGVAEFLFEGGARVILEGPCTFRFDSPSHGTLLLGSLTAQVPEEAVGFSVESGRMKIIDLGTEFGMVVSPSGATQTEVFTGQISARVRSAAADVWGESHILANSQVLSIDSMGSVSDKPVIDVKYVRQMPGAATRVAIRNPSFEQPVLPYGDDLDSEGYRRNHGVPVGWQVTKRSAATTQHGCLRPLDSEFSGILPHGRQVGYTNRGETLSQVLQEKCAPSTSYKLTVWLGIRREEAIPQKWGRVPVAVVELLAGETVLARSSAEEIRNLQPGSWQRVDVEFTSLAETPYEGQPLSIRLRAAADSRDQIVYDAIELTMVSREAVVSDQE